MKQEKHFWKVVIPVWICEISIWILAFGKNLPFGYVIAFFLTMVANAFLHKFGIKMTNVIYGPKKVWFDSDEESEEESGSAVLKFEDEPEKVICKLCDVLSIATKGVWGCDMIQSIVILVAYLIHKFVFWC